MSRWWILRLIWLILGVLTGVIAVLPESAETVTGIVALIFILATLVMLARGLTAPTAARLEREGARSSHQACR